MTVKTYSAWPFVALDGPDDNDFRAEVHVTKGLARGSDIEIEESKNGNAYNVSFAVDNNKHGVSAWVPKEDPVSKKLDDLQDDDLVEFRVERRRRKGVDRKTPIKELITLQKAGDSISKSLVAVKFERDDEWTYSPLIVTNPKEDPSDDNGLHSAFGMDVEPKKSEKKSGNFTSSFEAPPYRAINNDGSVNLGSSAVQAAISFYAFVLDETRKSDLVEYSSEEARRLSRILISIANRAQVEVYDGELERPDMDLGSSVRARAIVFDVVRYHYPITEELKEDSVAKTWARNVTDMVVELWKWSADIVKSTSKK